MTDQSVLTGKVASWCVIHWLTVKIE